MSQVPSSYDPVEPVRPLSIGNIVSAGIQLYRSHLKQYLGLSVRAYLWVLVPVYGWAKFSTIAALISRLAFCELVNQPESVDAADNRLNPKMWSFLVAGILMNLILMGVVTGLYILLAIAIFALVAIGLGSGQNPVVIVVLILLGIIAFLAFLAAFIWIYSRYLVTELPLAIEDNVSATEAISRSWKLTKGFVLRIQGIVLVAGLVSILITLPFQIAVQLISLGLQSDANVGPLSMLLVVLVIGLSLLSGAIVMPYWQAIKAVLYYDLRGRQEGMGLQLRAR